MPKKSARTPQIGAAAGIVSPEGAGNIWRRQDEQDLPDFKPGQRRALEFLSAGIL